MRYESLKAAGLPSSTMRMKVSRGILTASTLSTALTVADPSLQGPLEAGPDAGDLDRVVDDVVGARVSQHDRWEGHAPP